MACRSVITLGISVLTVALIAVLVADVARDRAPTVGGEYEQSSVRSSIKLALLRVAARIVAWLEPPEFRLHRLLFGSMHHGVVYQWAELDLARVIDQAGEVGATCEQVFDAALVALDALELPSERLSRIDAVCRLLKASAYLGLVEWHSTEALHVDEQGSRVTTRSFESRFTLTNVGRLLLPSSSSSSNVNGNVKPTPSLHSWALLSGRAELAQQSWHGLEREFRGDASGATRVEAFYRTLEANRALFDRSMDEFTVLQLASVTGSHDVARWLSTCSTVCDVGGGHGTLVHWLLARGLVRQQAVVVDIDASALARAEQRLEAAGFGSRARTLQWDMFDALSSEFDASSSANPSVTQSATRHALQACECVLMKGITSDWNDQRLELALHNVRRLAADGAARLLVLDHFLVDDDSANGARTTLVDASTPYTADSFTRSMDLLMMSLFGRGSRQRTKSEFVALAQRAGWQGYTGAFEAHWQAPLQVVALEPMHHDECA